MQTTLTLEKEEREAAPPPEPSRKQKLSGHTRASLLCGLATFLLFQAGLRVGIDNWWPELRDPAFEVKARALAEQLASAAEPPVTVLMMGSSMTGNSFKAKFLEDLLTRALAKPALVFNMSNLGAGPLTSLIWTRRLLER